MGCFTCGITYYAAVPIAVTGAVLGYFGRDNLKIAGLTLNVLALVPAIILLALFMGTGLATMGKKAVDQETRPPVIKPFQPNDSEGSPNPTTRQKRPSGKRTGP
jgi:hypothetical protein